MQLFLDTLASVGGTILAIVLGIVAITLFYHVVGLFSGGSNDVDGPTIFPSVLGPDVRATVHLLGGRTFENVRFIRMNVGYSQELAEMVVLEDDDGNRYFVREKQIGLVIVPSETNGDADDDTP